MLSAVRAPIRNPSAISVGRTSSECVRILSVRLLFLILLASPVICPAQMVWNGGGTNDNWTTSQNWAGGIAPISSTSTFIRFQGTVRSTPFADANAPWILNRIDFETRADPNPHSFTLSGNQLSFQGTAPQIYCYASAPQTINNDIEISAAGFTIDGLNAPPITFNGHLSGPGALTIGNANLFLTNSNTYEGATSLSGNLTISNGLALGSSGTKIVMTLGGQLRLVGDINVAPKNLSMASGSGFYRGLINLSGKNTWNGDINLTFASGIWSLSANDTLIVTGNIDGGGNSLQTGGVGDLILSGNISNLHYDLDKYGTGTLTLSGTNSNVYQVIIDDGTLVATHANSLPVMTPIQLDPSSGVPAQDAHPTLRIEEDTTVGGLSGYSYGGNATVQLGAHTLTVHQDFYSNYPGAITGTGALIKTGSGSLELSGPSTYSGGTFISNGAVRINQDTALGAPPDVGAVNVSISNGELEAANCAQVTLDSRRIVVLNGGCSLAMLGCVNATPFIVTGQITGPGSLTIIGAGIVELSNPNNNYLGYTRVHEGTLQLDSPGAIGGSGPDVQIDAGAIVALAYAIDQSFLARVATVSQGKIALAADSTNDLDLASAGLGQVTLAALGVRTLRGKITAPNGTYRLGGLNGVLVLMAEDALSGNASLQAGIDQSQVGTVALSNNNSLNGDAVVRGGTLQVTAATLSCNQLETKTQAKTHLGSATLNADVLIDAGGLLDGCGTINGNVTNNGSVVIDCSTGLQLSGATVNNGTMTILGGATLIANGPFTNNGILDLLTSPGTILPPQFINNGTVIYPGAVNIRTFSKLGSTFTIKVQSLTGHNYQLQRSLNLASADWQNIGNPRAGSTGNDISLTDNAVTTNAAFYRIQVSP